MADELPAAIKAAPPGGTLASERKPLFVVVLGVHRSGTSLCSHVLSALGIDMADDPVPQPSNPKGHWERWEIVEFHDRILGLFDRRYLTPLHDLPLPPGWLADARVGDIKREIMAFLDRRMATGVPFGFKDPRTARLLGLWQQIFTEIDRPVKIVLCLRNPAQVARSLNERDGLPLDMGEYRWFNYMAEVFSDLRNNVCTIEYEAWFGGNENNTTKLVQFLGWDPASLGDNVVAAVSRIVDRQLRHDDPGLRTPRQPLIQAFYEAVCRFNVDAAARTQVARIVHQFNQFRDLQQWFDLEFEQLSGIAGVLARLDREDAGAPIVSWRDPRVQTAQNKLIELARRSESAEHEASGDAAVEAAGLVPADRSSASDPTLMAPAFASDVPARREVLGGPRHTVPQAPIFFRYEPISAGARDLMLGYRTGDSPTGSRTSDAVQVCLRWFDSAGRVLIWQSRPTILDLAATDHWQPVPVEIPLFPARAAWLRFEVLAAAQPQQMALCTGFLFGTNDYRAQPDMSTILAYTHASLSAEFLDNGTRCLGASASDDDRRLMVVGTSRPAGRHGVVRIGIDSLRDIEFLLFVDWNCFGKRRVVARIPPLALSAADCLILPVGEPGGRVFGFGRTAGPVRIVLPTSDETGGPIPAATGAPVDTPAGQL